VRIDDILGRLKKVQPTGPQQWQVLCPAHDDKVPSFHIATGDNGNILVHCKADCSFDKICTAMNVSPKDLFVGDNSRPIKSNGKNKLLSDSDIRTLTPEELNVFTEQCEVVADALMLFEPNRHVSKPWIVLPGYNPSGTKPCGYIRLDPNGGLVTLAGGRKEKSPAIGKHGFLGVPWIKKVNPEEIILAEGWRDVLAAIGQCFCATAPSDGASTFKKEWAGLFQNRIVYICFDCDKPGVKAARKAAKMIAPVAKEVRIIKLPYEIAKDHGDDLHDYLVRDKHTQADLQQLIDEAQKLPAGSNECIQLLQWAAFSQSAARLREMLELASFMEPIVCLPSIFDADPWLLNCLNGTINLRTGELRQHHPADMLTKLCPVNYDPDATFDMWDEFLETATDSNQEL
jgi:hypothetical protein